MSSVSDSSASAGAAAGASGASSATAALSAKIEAIEPEIKELKGKLTALDGKLTALDREITALDVEIAAAEGQHDAAAVERLSAKRLEFKNDRLETKEEAKQLRAMLIEYQHEKNLLLEAQQQRAQPAAAAAAASVPIKTVHVTCVHVARTPFTLVLKGPARPAGPVSLKEEIVEQMLRATSLPRRVTPDKLQSMLVFNNEGILGDFDAVKDNDALELRWQQQLQEVSGNEWSETQLDQLKIAFEFVDSSNELLAEFAPVPSFSSPRVQHVLDLMDGVGIDFFRDRYADEIAQLRKANGAAAAVADESMLDHSAQPAAAAGSPSRSSAASAASSSPSAHEHRLLHPLWKTLYMMIKYPTVEALVDEFVSLLLRELMERLPESKWLYVFPQLPLPLIFGVPPNHTLRTMATADRTIVDVGSFYRMSVFEDKSIRQQLVNSEPQLIAEAIAAHQANMQIKEKAEPAATAASKKQKHAPVPATPSASAATAASASPSLSADEPMLAVRVSGDLFFFYSVRVTDALLQAMARKTEAASFTTVLKLCRPDEQGLSFFTPSDRRKIVETLDQMCQCIARAGHASRRRESGASGAAPGAGVPVAVTPAVIAGAAAAAAASSSTLATAAAFSAPSSAAATPPTVNKRVSGSKRRSDEESTS